MKTILPRLALIGALALPVAACAPGDDPTAPSPVQVMREVALQQVRLLNAQGVDPIQLSAERLAYLSSACAIITAVVTVYNPAIAAATAADAETCAAIAEAAAKANGPAA